MREPLKITIGDFTFHVIVTGWPSRGGATSPPYGADWHLDKISCHGEPDAPTVPFTFGPKGTQALNERVQEAVADWLEQDARGPE